MALFNRFEYLSVGEWGPLILGEELLRFVDRVTAFSSFHCPTHGAGLRHLQIVHAQTNGPAMRENDLGGEAVKIPHDDLAARSRLPQN